MVQSNFTNDEKDTDTVPMYRFRQLSDEVDKLRAQTDTLSLNQVWLLAKYLGAVVLLATGVFGAALWIMVKETAEARASIEAETTAKDIARETAKNVSQEDVIEALLANPDFIGTSLEQLSQLLPNAVIAFSESCPDGWETYEQLAGRVIVGAGEHTNRDSNDNVLRSYNLYDFGGEEEHILKPEAMPPHRHTVTSSPPDTNIHDGFGGSAQNFGLRPQYDPSVQPRTGWSTTQHPDFMSEEGQGVAHNNMQPYFALLYCIKE